MNAVATTQSQGALQPLELNAAIIRQFVTISPQATVAEAIAHLSALEETNGWASARQTGVGTLEAVPVRCLVTVEAGRILGICTEHDLVNLGAQNAENAQTLIADVAAPVKVTLRESDCTDFSTVAQLFTQCNTLFIPVLDDQDQLSGLLTYQGLLTLSRPTSLMECQGIGPAIISDFVCAEPSTAMRAIVQLLTTHNVAFAVVLDPSTSETTHKIPLGLITERDIVQVQALGQNLDTTTAAELMRTLHTVAPDTSAHRAYQLMGEVSTPCLGVRGPEGTLLGIVTRSSLLQTLDPEALFAVAEFLEQRIVKLETQQQAYGPETQGNSQPASPPQPSLALGMSQQEQFLAALTNASPVGIFHTNPEGQCDFVNDRWCEIAGLTPAMANGWGWAQALHPEDRDRVAVEWAKSIAEARPFQLEYRFCNAQGQITWVQGQAVAEWDAEGEIVGYVGTITDISAQRLTQEKLEFQIELDRLVANISSRFIQLSSTSTTNDINLALQEIGEFTQVDSSYIFQFSDLENVHSMTHEWVAPGIPSNLHNTQNLPFSLFPWASARLQNGESVYIADSTLLPPEAAIDQQTLDYFGIQSALNIPLIAHGKVKGFVGFVTFREPRHWSADNIRLLQIFADILMHVLQRQQTEVELQRSKQQYVSLAESVPAGLFRTDITGNCIYINSYWCHLSGLDTESSLGLGWAQAIHPEDRDRVITQWQQCVMTQTIFQQEYRLQHTDGHIVWVYAQAVVEYNHQGQISGYIGTLTDISAAKQSEAERKIVELALRQQEETLQLFAKHAPVGIAMLDSNFCYIYASQRWIDNYNLNSIDTLKGRSHYEIFPEVPERWRHIHQRCLDGAIERCEEDLFERADGTKQWIRWEIRPWYQTNRSIGGIIIFSEDISERKQAQRSLQASEERLRLALAAANQGLYDLNLKTGEAIVNSEYATMLGYDPTTFQETHENWVARMHPEDREQVAPVYHNYIAGVIPNYKVEFRQRTNTGEWKWILSLGKIVEWDEHNQPLRMLGTHTDISDRKQAELRLKEANRKITNIWESMIDAYITMDRDWRIIYANPTATQIFANLTNLKPEEFLGKTYWELFPMFVGQDLEREYRRAIDEQVAIHLEVQHEPTAQWFEIYAYPSREGLGVYFRDISDRIRAEAERCEAEQTRSELKLLENILDVILAGYWDWNIPEDQEYCSSGFMRLLGYTDDALPDNSPTWKDLIFPEDLPIILDSRDRHIRSGGVTPCYSEVRYRHRNGSTIWVMCAGQAIEWDDMGHPIRMIGCHIDITARKQAEA
ncbi:MAG TPA: PAS domain S-box protein, partial [Stenomitos sp.]